ncbi:hypothetical protein E1263_23705 [Kribbella antibiotica]|uniref:Fibronectin type III domain-containing protein n=1 Tax=Kribbella antibiotica TaxID=190195 RepID=A0A4R4ZFW1_9ACTN|nr:hypothetical protein [Kribbella antibiotica]TDD57458.1 hypothetical protein E1263_23705 [Kribbella antibiotica]
MRKLLATATIAALLTAGLATPAWAAAPDAPTDVQVAWVGDKIRVTWKDNGEANDVATNYPGIGLARTNGRTEAGDDNELLIDRSKFANEDRVLIRVFVRTAEGGQGPSATSSEFDSRIPVYPIIEDADLLADGSVKLVRWTQPAVVDTNPGDPLDRPASDEYLGAQIAVPGSPVERLPIPASATSFTVPPRPRPATISLYAGNEWRESYLSNGDGPRLERQVLVGTLSAAAAVPAMGIYSLQLGIKTTLTSNLANMPMPVQLQARPNSASPWKTYGRYNGNLNRPFHTDIASLGERQYRIWVPSAKQSTQSAIKLTPAASTTARTSKSTAKAQWSGIQPYDTEAGRMVTLKVYVEPGVNMKAALQRRVGKTWKYVRELPLTKGRLTLQFRATRQAQTWYRVVTPPVKVNGLPVLAGTSLDYAFTVR